MKTLLLGILMINAFSYTAQASRFSFARRYFRNMRANQVLTARERIPSRERRVEKRSFQKAQLHGRYYITGLVPERFGDFFRMTLRYYDKAFFGDNCDPREFPYSFGRTGYIVDGFDRFFGLLGCAGNESHVEMHKDSSVIREGRRVSMCEGYAYPHRSSPGPRPHEIINSMFDNTEVNDDSIQYAFHLFNPYVKLPEKAMNGLLSMMTEEPNDPRLRRRFLRLREGFERQTIRLEQLNAELDGGGVSDSRKRYILSQIERIKSSEYYEFTETLRMSKEEKWSFIFYTFCKDPHSQII